MRSVAFNANGGTGSMSEQWSTPRGKLSASTLTPPAGKTFLGWSSTQSATTATYLDQASTFPFNAWAQTLYAVWGVSTRTVTFHADFNGASPATTTQSGNSGTSANLNGTFTRPGYMLSGWATNSGGPTTYSPVQNFTFNADTDLYALWTANTNTVTYHSDHGVVPGNGSFSTGGNLTLPSPLSAAGYRFDGWFEASSGGLALSSGYNPSATNNIDIYAHWTSLLRTVSFNANGGTGIMPDQSGFATTTLNTNTIARTGYGFTGWNTIANGSGTAYAVDATHPFTSSETLYAQWRALPATPIAAVDIQVPVGSAIANAPVDLDVDGLKDQTGYTVTVFSTPQIIDQGTIWSGRLNTTVRIPSNLEAGWHRLVIEGTAADGTPWTEENFFKVSPGGILLATSEVVPAELAMTGSQAVPVFYSAGFLILLGFGFLAANVTLRRRNNK
ncbi:InlB B-repeat-containing protein [Aurantimicrobium minutum]|uniref:InlB B-repeat-containing protein n=1 Tax=Aurantimicrobium minutum TaxID=708131 RepID=UPI003D7B0AD5